MAYSALGALQPESKKLWVKESIRTFREAFFFTKFMGKDENNIVQLVTDLTPTEKGDQALIGLVADLQGTGIVGDNDINGRYEDLASSFCYIKTDQLRNGVKSKGRVDDQRSVFDFRSSARDRLAFWRANILEELMFLAASGIGFNYTTNGGVRPTSAQDSLIDLDFASDVTTPSTNRSFMFDGTNVVTSNTANIASTYIPKYGAAVDMAANARTKGIKPLRINGKDHYVWLMHPKSFARLKKDPDFRDAITQGSDRGKEVSPVLTGATLTIDGLIIQTNNRVYNTSGALAGSKWGAGGNIDGTRSLLMGCQALALADLWGAASWYEGKDDDDAKQKITIGMYAGVKKPKFLSRLDGNTVEDFGIMTLDLYL